ncbi:DNA ligase 1 [Nosema granulosis]|uniref:DNA ligase n=1 Tax=Nosema granulosis TaxID=83296 RepID=A0A9P6GYX6_9MICR|nr:DNA ligase 1 [Nosema granulosis]
MDKKPEALFVHFAERMERISFLKGRLEIQSTLTEYFKEVEDDLVYAVYLATTTFFPEYKNKQLNIGDKIIYDVLSESTGLKVTTLRKEYAKEGDFGTIGMLHRAPQLFISPRRLSLKDVVCKLREVADISGTKSKTLKMRKMLEMVAICSPLEIKYIFRIFEEKLKVKIAFSTVLTSLAKMYPGEHVENVKGAYYRRPDIELLIRTISEKGIENLSESFGMVPGIPLKPMLAQPTKDVSTAYKKVENKLFTCEYKYDGERVQIHSHNGMISIYSRNLEESTVKFGDVKVVSKNQKDFIIDGEVVAYDVENKKILSFQTLSTRKRKDTNEVVKVCIFVFDILFFDGVNLIEKSLRERREILYNEFEEIESKFYFSEHLDCKSVEEIDGFFQKSCEQNYEGIMIKLLEEGSTYLPSQRSNSWIKLKKDYIDNGGDSFDLVVVGAYYGKGKRTGVYGGFLLASFNDSEGVFETVCKIGTGFSEENLSKLYEELNNYVTEVPKDIRYKDQTKPDVWISPKLVWEVKAAGVSLSPVYCSGIDNESRGLSLRFPRFIRSRDDKGPEDGTTSDQIYSMYREINDL